MSISAEGAKAFAEEILAIEGQPAWVIGTVEVVSNIVVGSYFFYWMMVIFIKTHFCLGYKASAQAGSGKARIVDNPTIIEV